MAKDDAWFDGYRRDFKPQIEGLFKSPTDVSLEFRHGASSRIDMEKFGERYGDTTKLYREISKVLLDSRGAWATVAILYQRRKSITREFGDPKLWLFRMVKRGTKWRVYSTMSMDAFTMHGRVVPFLEAHLEFEEEDEEEDEEYEDEEEDDDGQAA